MDDKSGGSAFPTAGDEVHAFDPGMSLRDYFAGQALSNSAICTGEAKQYELDAWFGKYATSITRRQIVAKQAAAYADAMLAERAKEPT